MMIDLCRINFAEADDSNAIPAIDIALQCFPGCYADIVSEMPRPNCKTATCVTQSIWIVASYDQQAVAFAQLQRDKFRRDVLWLSRIGVSLVCRRQRIGTRLFEKAKEWAAGEMYSFLASPVPPSQNTRGFLRGLFGDDSHLIEIEGQEGILATDLTGAGRRLESPFQLPRQATFTPPRKPWAVDRLRSAERRFVASRTARITAVRSEDFPIVDMSLWIKDQTPNPQMDSLAELMATLFPIETERELVYDREDARGLSAYVAEDQQTVYGTSQRKVLARLDPTGQRVVAAVVYGAVSFENNKHAADGIDGFLGVTYLMTHPEFRRFGLGKQLLEEAERRSKLLVTEKTGKDNPEVAVVAELNNPRLVTLTDTRSDFSGARIDPISRLYFWQLFGLMKVSGFEYIQTSIRPNLDPCTVLDFFVRVPKDRASQISKTALHDIVKAYSDLCLNKRLREIDEDNSWRRMEGSLLQRATFDVAPAVCKPIAEFNRLWAALMLEVAGVLNDRSPRRGLQMGNIIDEYGQAVAKHFA